MRAKKYFFIFLIIALILSFSVAVKADSTTLLEPNYQTWLAAQKLTKAETDATVTGTSASLTGNQSISYTVNAPADGLYRLQLTYLSTSDSLINPELSVQINGGFEFYESRNIQAPTLWQNKSAKFLTNQTGDDLIPEQKVYAQDNTIILNDGSYDQAQGLLFYFHKGDNTLTLQLTSGSLTVKQLAVLAGTVTLPTYAQYLAKQPTGSVKNQISFEAEKTAFKNTSYAQPQMIRSADVSPYSSSKRLLNVFGGSSWNQSGQAVSWKFHVDKAGRYTITVKNQQNNQGKPVFRQIALDGQVPFDALEAYRFDTNSNWTNTTLGDGKTSYAFYLSAGDHTLTMTATDAPISSELFQLNQMMRQINNLGLQIQKLTGNNSNPNYQWNIKQFIPNVDTQFSGWLKQLGDIRASLVKTYGTQNAKAQELVQLGLVTNQLQQIAKDPNKLPTQLQNLSQGSASITETLATIQTTLESQPLTIDKFYVSAGETLPAPTVGFWQGLFSGIAEFFSSFGGGGGGSGPAPKKTITVWVERSQQYVDLMQSVADSDYTPKTGIKVNFQIMPDESKLLLAAASGEAPDVALGVSVGTPYNLALRGAVEPLNQFPGFQTAAKQFSPGAIIPMMIGKTVYGLPETQDFYVQFTRNDILNKLNITPPDNWNQVLTDLPQLQRYGMNYYIPLSGTAGTKAMMFTAPFIFQFGGSLYSPNGQTTAITDSKSINGLKFMTDLYTTYSLPLQVNSFYNSFRYGQIPMGISNFQSYVQLQSAAPEIANEWSIQPYPGVPQADGSVNREAPGSAQEDMIFKSAKNKTEAWNFLSWWMSSATQSKFATQLQTDYGPSYMWNTANLSAFQQLPWPQADKNAILTQWQQLEEAPQTPAGYMEERQISNVWTDVVFNGQNIRAAVENNAIIINKEITSRLTDFGYIQNGKLIKPYQIPTVDTVKEVLDEK